MYIKMVINRTEKNVKKQTWSFLMKTLKQLKTEYKHVLKLGQKDETYDNLRHSVEVDNFETFEPQEEDRG